MRFLVSRAPNFETQGGVTKQSLARSLANGMFTRLDKVEPGHLPSKSFSELSHSALAIQRVT